MDMGTKNEEEAKTVHQCLLYKVSVRSHNNTVAGQKQCYYLLCLEPS